MKFNTISEVTNHQFIGNHASDYAAFNAIHDAVMDDEWSMADKAEALRQMGDRGMGCGRDEHQSDQQVVDGYVSEM